MNIKTVTVGNLRANCYIISINKNCLIIDPGDDADIIIKEIGNLKPIGIIVTHYHFDHVGALDAIKDKYQIPIYDSNNIVEGINKAGNFEFEMIHTKGHDDTCITIYFKEEKVMFTGDFLFKDTIGRTDLGNSNHSDMMASIKKIKQYDDDIVVYPGHGMKTNLGYEKTHNYFFQ